jgi:hypothetical protein
MKSTSDPFVNGITALVACPSNIGPWDDYSHEQLMTLDSVHAEEFASRCATSTLLAMLTSVRFLAAKCHVEEITDASFVGDEDLLTVEDFYFRLNRALGVKARELPDATLIFAFVSDVVRTCDDDVLLVECIEIIGTCTPIADVVVEFLLQQGRRADSSDQFRIAVLESISQIQSINARSRVFELGSCPMFQSEIMQEHLNKTFAFVEDHSGPRDSS